MLEVLEDALEILVEQLAPLVMDWKVDLECRHQGRLPHGFPYLQTSLISTRLWWRL